MKKYLIVISMSILAGCNSNNDEQGRDGNTTSKPIKGTFGYDVSFLKKYHKDIVVLGDTSGAQVIIAPAYQGRVMTSSADGNAGLSFGWINHDLIASGKNTEHMVVFV